MYRDSVLLASLALASPLAIAPAHALTMKECSAKYNAAKEAGTLGNMKWNDFRKAQCGADATAAAATPNPAKPDTKTSTSTAKQQTAAAGQSKGLNMTQCSAKFKAAQEANATTLKWNDFRKAECGPGADPEALTSNDTKEPPAATTAAPKGVSFPSSVSAKYASETPAKARMHTCLDQYYANKNNNTLGGLKWIQKGGGFYSLCNAKLKG